MLAASPANAVGNLGADPPPVTPVRSSFLKDSTFSEPFPSVDVFDDVCKSPGTLCPVSLVARGNGLPPCAAAVLCVGGVGCPAV